MSFPKVYTVNGPSSTSASSLPSWLAVKTRPSGPGKKKRTKTQHTVGDLELIQDFGFPGSAIRVKTTEDGLHAIATGTYKPMMKVWDLEQLTVKFERVTDAENVDFVILSSDWTKTLHLQRDRSLALHTQGGLHHSVRLPTYGRTLGYHSPSADAIVGCTGTEVYRFNLEEGRYMTPLNVAKGWGDGREDEVEGVNVVDVNKRHGLWSFGLDGAGGVVEFWDPRSRSALTRLSLPSSTLLPAQTHEDTNSLAPIQKLSVTALSSHPTDGLSFAVGTSTGHTLLYDLRSPTPFAVKDQGYGEAIRNVDWLRGGGAQEDTGRVVSADSKVIKIWDKADPSNNHLSLHPPNSLVDLHPVPQSGLLFAACDSPQMSAYYVPEIGPAPKWASFLDNVTEEMGDDLTGGAGKSAYADFKFIDKTELDTLGLTHLIGTPALKPYMHGYFLSLKLYTTARLIANPQSYDEYRDKLVADKLKAKTESRIRARKDQPKVNKALAERLRKAEEREKALEKRKKERRGEVVAEDVEEEESDGEGKSGKGEASLLADPRFKEIFENPDFEVDEESREFALLNPATVNNNAKRKTAVEEEEDESDRMSSDLEEESEEESDAAEQDDDDDAESGSDESDDGDLRQYDPRRLKPSERVPRPLPRSTPRLVVGSASASTSSAQQPTFGQRLASSSASSSFKGKKTASSAEDDPNVLAMRRTADGGMEMSFIPTSKPSHSGGNNSDDDGNGSEDDEYSGGTRRKDRKVEKFGAGLEKGGGEDDDDELAGRGGRTQRRHPGRSASKNAFRRR
ncbi:ribosome biogenesis protein ENP2 [Kwoniella heveanensis BCC8398]|uniref:Ribosome biogenesis protein ENP2 n=1 Tax=Kwoniella heveanensis BCC8398 TaxID=1296120 RepID=A0A1B9GM11_9TREE|nr:ribosome biogenesis protein ENP2 [Kwoniella heveanensis BCC8398]